MGFVRAKWLVLLSLSLFVAPVDAASPILITLPNQQVADIGSKLTLPAAVTNLTNGQVAVDVEYQIQVDPAFYAIPAPDPIFGKDVALGAKSWAEGKGVPITERNEVWGQTNGKVTSINAMTDGRNWTEFGTIYYNKGNLWTETFGFIDLGKPFHVVHLAADMIRQPAMTGKIDFSASLDGKEYTTIQELQNVDVRKGDGRFDIAVPKPFEARFIRMRLHQDGAEVNFFRYPANIHVYGGIDEHTWDFPQVGAVISSGKLSRTVAAKESASVDIGDGQALEPGSYLVAARVSASGSTQTVYTHVFVLPPPVVAKEPRFGINVTDPANISVLKQAGVGSVRFELKWPNVSSESGVYKYDIPVAPMNVTYDNMLKTYHDAGVSALPCLFLTPEYLLPKEIKDPKSDPGYNPPVDFGKFGEFVFQTVARYGRQKHPADVLLTSDKVSGLGYADSFELWNEPNTKNTRLSCWKGSLDDYYKFFRIGAEAAKKADPAVKIANGGWSHAETLVYDTMRTFKYSDGKTPLDFTDIFSVHYFSFRVEPELATVYDISHHHEFLPYERTVEDDLAAMVAWRDTNKPGLPIWVTAIGHDAMDVDEQHQAAWLPRGILTALGAGVDNVQVYQEKGSGAFQFGATGLLRNDDNTLKPAWFTYATLIRQFNGISDRAKKLPTNDSNVRAYLWKRNGEPLVTAWVLKGTGKLDLPLGRCAITDAFGARHAADVSQSLELSEFPVYVSDFKDPAIVEILKQQADQFSAETVQRMQRDSNRHAYLFKFGRNERLASMVIGTSRTFTPVAASDMYDETKGYGFETSGLKDTSLPYYQNPLTDSGVRAVPKTRFTFKARPGDYNLRLCVRSPDREVKFTGFTGGEVTLKGSLSNLITSATVKVGNDPITLEAPTGCELVWLTLVEADANSPATKTVSFGGN